MTADELRVRVLKRIGDGLDLALFENDAVEARWRRRYGTELSDERFAAGITLSEVFRAILECEDRADAEEEAER